MKKYLIIDFDSTLTKVEALDELAKKSLECRKDCERTIKKILKTTELGMNGEISFSESLQKRVRSIKATKKDIAKVAEMIKGKITDSVLKNKDFFKENKENIYIISGGFKELIFPTAEAIGIKREHILANKFVFNKEGVVIGVDRENLMSQDYGKVKQIKKLNLKGKSVMVGDGWTDFQARESLTVDKFIVFIENISREKVIEKADYVAKSFDEVIKYFNKI